MALVLIVNVVKVVVVAVLLVAPATSQPNTEFVTKDNWHKILLPSFPPALTLIKFSADTNTSDIQVRYETGVEPYTETFKVHQNDEERNTIIVMYKEDTQGVVIWNLLTNMEAISSFKVQQAYVWSKQRVRWQVFDEDPALLNTLTVHSPASTKNTTLLSTSPSSYLSTTFLILASLCALLALSTLVLSVFHCHRCGMGVDRGPPPASPRPSRARKSSSTSKPTFPTTTTAAVRSM